MSFKFNPFAEMDDLLATDPDAVIAPAGGLPDAQAVAGDDRPRSARNILAGDVKPGRDLPIPDDAGGDAALLARDP